MLRSVLGVVSGAVIWFLGFYVLAIGLGLLWPDYALHSRQWVQDNVFSFTPIMACSTIALWIVAEIGAGWIVQKISSRRFAVWTLAGLIGLYLATLHWALYWNRFPWWYNLGVVLTAVPAVLLGGYSELRTHVRG